MFKENDQVIVCGMNPGIVYEIPETTSGIYSVCYDTTFYDDVINADIITLRVRESELRLA